jgi:hypothetical protein
MKPMMMIAAVVMMLAAAAAQARLGETEEQCAARYGESLKTEKATPPDEKTAIHIKGEIGIVLSYYKGKVGAALYTRPDGKSLSANQVEILLDANKGEHEWKLVPGQFRKIWQRSDGAQADLDVQEKQLFLITRELGEAKEAARKAAEAKKLEGF